MYIVQLVFCYCSLTRFTRRVLTDYLKDTELAKRRTQNESPQTKDPKQIFLSQRSHANDHEPTNILEISSQGCVGVCIQLTLGLFLIQMYFIGGHFLSVVIFYNGFSQKAVSQKASCV